MIKNSIRLGQLFRKAADSRLIPTFIPRPNDKVRENAKKYIERAGLPHFEFDNSYAPINKERARAIADAYNEAIHNPNDKAVYDSYKAFKKETLEQFNHLVEEGVKFEPWLRPEQPYRNSDELRKDIQENNHVYFYVTFPNGKDGEA